MANSLRVSVVLPTYNRCGRLSRVLARLSAQTIAPSQFEVVVVDDGSTDGTPEMLANAAMPFSLKPIRQENSGPAKARNNGVGAASAPLVLFLDDDVEPVPELLQEHLSWHDREQDIAVIGPLASLPHYRQPWVAWEQRKLEQQYEAMAMAKFEPTFRQFWTGNASVSRRSVLAAGGFNSTYLRAEDVELGVRLRDLGLKFRFNPKARGFHHAERPLRSWENAQNSYGRLEVEIFGILGEAELIGVLQDNWGHLHLATRWLVGSCVGRKQAEDLASGLLRRWLLACEKRGWAVGTQQACSLLANLLYWSASTKALGPERSEQIFGASREPTR